MKKLIAALCFTAGAALAQPYPFNESGVTMGHWHLNSSDIEASKKIFVAMGGTAMKPGDFELVRFPGVLINLHLRQPAPPANGGTIGSVVNHVGFIVNDVQASTARWKAAGVPVEPGSNGRLDQAYVTTPDGLRIEILEDKNQSVPIRHEHVHLFLPEAAIPEAQAWYVKTFGAKAGERANNPVADIPGVQMRFAKTETPAVTTKGRILDYIGFDVQNIDSFTQKLAAAGIKLDRPIARNEKTRDALTFFYDPWGTYIELNERHSQ